MDLSARRILKDYKNYKASSLDKDGVYCIMDESNFYEMKAMIVGPKDTPYEGGFYFFLLKFTKDYPHKPPFITFHTLDKRVRFNPNYYKCGKVCLSILGTWSGPGWTSCMSLQTILIVLQTRLNEMPIQNEPGFETCKDKRAIQYNDVLKWYNLEVAVYRVKNKPPPGFQEFMPFINKEFEKHKEYYTNYLQSILKQDSKNIKSPYFSLYALLKPYYIMKELGLNAEISQTTKTPDIVNNTTKSASSKSRRVPNEKASNYDVGYEMQSENNKQMYIVALRKDNRKYWKRKN